MGEILTQTAKGVGEAQTSHQSGLGNTGIVFAALKSGSIDVYPEYTGTIGQELLQSKTPLDLPTMDARLAALGLAAGIPLGFNDTYALAMRDEQAQKLGIKTLTDLAKHPELKLGLSQEFLKRADGWPGVKAVYGLPFESPQGLDHGLAYEAIAGGQIDVTDIYSTDSKIAKYKLRVLDDDKHYFPAYDAVLLYRRDLPQRLPRTWAKWQTLQSKITAPQMIALNAQVELQNQTPQAIATAYLSGKAPAATTGNIDGREANGNGFWATLFAPDFWPETRQHLFLVFVSLLVKHPGWHPAGHLGRADTPRRAAHSQHDRTDSDHSVPGFAGFFDPATAPDRPRSGNCRSVSLLPAADCTEYLHRPDRHCSQPAGISRCARPAIRRAPALD